MHLLVQPVDSARIAPDVSASLYPWSTAKWARRQVPRFLQSLLSRLFLFLVGHHFLFHKSSPDPNKGSDTSDTAPASYPSSGTNCARIAYRSNPLYEHNHSAYSMSILFLFFLSPRASGLRRNLSLPAKPPLIRLHAALDGTKSRMISVH